MLSRFFCDMDIKIQSKGRATKGKGRYKQGSRGMLSRMPINSMILRTRWEYGALSTGGAGTIANGNVSPSISNSSEYSSIQNFFTEVRLLKCTITITSNANSSTTLVNGRLMLATNMLGNQNAPISVTSATQVQNSTKLKYIQVGPSFLRPVRYSMPVPKDLEFSNIVADAPATVTPWAGSPGVIVMWANHLTLSVQYYVVDVEATYELRARQ